MLSLSEAGLRAVGGPLLPDSGNTSIIASPRVSSPMLASKTKQEWVRDNQRRSRARRQEYIAALERRLRENHSTYRDADLQKSAFLDLQREIGYLRHLLMMAGVSSGVINTFMHQNTTRHDRQSDELSFSGRQLKPKLHVLPSPCSNSWPTWSDGSGARSVETSAISSIEPWNSTIRRAGTYSLYSESDLQQCLRRSLEP